MPEIDGEPAGFRAARAVWPKGREGEKNLLCRKLIQSIIYSKESIEIRLFARADFPASEKENFCRTGGGDSSRENEWRPWVESNHHPQLRRLVPYPLGYRDEFLFFNQVEQWFQLFVQISGTRALMPRNNFGKNHITALLF